VQDARDEDSSEEHASNPISFASPFTSLRSHMIMKRAPNLIINFPGLTSRCLTPLSLLYYECCLVVLWIQSIMNRSNTFSGTCREFVKLHLSLSTLADWMCAGKSDGHGCPCGKLVTGTPLLSKSVMALSATA